MNFCYLKKIEMCSRRMGQRAWSQMVLLRVIGTRLPTTSMRWTFVRICSVVSTPMVLRSRLLSSSVPSSHAYEVRIFHLVTWVKLFDSFWEGNITLLKLRALDCSSGVVSTRATKTLIGCWTKRLTHFKVKSFLSWARLVFISRHSANQALNMFHFVCILFF